MLSFLRVCVSLSHLSFVVLSSAPASPESGSQSVTPTLSSPTTRPRPGGCVSAPPSPAPQHVLPRPRAWWEPPAPEARASRGFACPEGWRLGGPGPVGGGYQSDSRPSCPQQSHRATGPWHLGRARPEWRGPVALPADLCPVGTGGRGPGAAPPPFLHLLSLHSCPPTIAASLRGLFKMHPHIVEGAFHVEGV